MSARDDGGPAFPVDTARDRVTGEYGHQTGNSTWQCGGMTMRDYFAAQAIAGACSNAGPCPSGHGECDYIAMYAYRLADAMLKERAKAQASEPGERNE